MTRQTVAHQAPLSMGCHFCSAQDVVRAGRSSECWVQQHHRRVPGDRSYPSTAVFHRNLSWEVKGNFCCSVPQSRLTCCDPMGCNPPSSSVHGILQARIPEWVVIPFSRGSLRSRDRARASCGAGRFLAI